MPESETKVFPELPALCPIGPNGWQLDHDYMIPVFGRVLTVPKGFKTDLASVPAFFRAFIDDTSLGAASVIAHDFLYQRSGWVFSEGIDLTRREVDHLFSILMRLERVPALRRKVAWLAVRVAGWACWHHSEDRIVALSAL